MSLIQEISPTEKILNVGLLHEFCMKLYVHLSVLDAANKHHEYLVRLEKEESLEAKAVWLKSSRVKQRRIRVSKSFMRFGSAFYMQFQFLSFMKDGACKPKEWKSTLCSKLVKKLWLMDDDGDSQVLVRRMPPWHSSKLTKLMVLLDSRKCANAIFPFGAPIWLNHHKMYPKCTHHR